jgi:hypothetical protein
VHEDVILRFVHLLMNNVPSLMNSLGTSASSLKVPAASDMFEGRGRDRNGSLGVRGVYGCVRVLEEGLQQGS